MIARLHFSRRATLTLMLVTLSLIVLACDVASLIPQAKAPASQPAPVSQEPSSSSAAPQPSSKSSSAAAQKSAQTPTAQPTPSVAKVGQRVVSEGLAITINQVQKASTLQGQEASAGMVFIVTSVTIENVSNKRLTVEESQFEYVDKDGSVLGGLMNAPSAPGTMGKDVLGYHELLPNGKLVNKLLPAVIEQGLVPGLQLLFTIDDSHSIMWNLGL